MNEELITAAPAVEPMAAPERIKPALPAAVQRKLKRSIRQVEIALKNTRFCRYRLVFVMLALEKLITDLTLKQGGGEVSVCMEGGDKIVVTIENPELTSTMVKDLVDQAIRDDLRFHLAKALLDVDEFQFTHRSGPGLKLTVSKRLH